MRRLGMVIIWFAFVFDSAFAVQTAGAAHEVLEGAIHPKDAGCGWSKKPLNTPSVSPSNRLFKRGLDSPALSSTLRPRASNRPPASSSQGQSTARERSRSPSWGSNSDRNNTPAPSSSNPGRSGSPARSHPPGSEAYKSIRSQSSSPPPSPRRSSSSTTSSGWSTISSGRRSSGRSSTSGTTDTTSDSGSSRDSRGYVGWPHNVIPPTYARLRAQGPSMIGSRTTTETRGPVVIAPGQVPVLAGASSPYKSTVFGTSFGAVAQATASGDIAKAHIRTGPDSRGILRTAGPEGERIIDVGPNTSMKVRTQTDLPGLEPVAVGASLHGEGNIRAQGRNLRRRGLVGFD